MVKLGLYIKADLENVTDLIPVEDYEWHFKIQCTSCHEIDDSWISFNQQDEYDMKSRGTANLVMRCKFCKRDLTAQFEPSFKIRKYNVEQNGKDQQIAQFDCRGLELVEFQPRVSVRHLTDVNICPLTSEIQDSWTCKGTESGTIFEDIDFLCNC